MAVFVKLERLYYRAGPDATPLVLGDIDVERGAAMVLMGPNGAGKSTLLALCAGLIRPWCGRVLIDGRDLSTLDGRQVFSLAAGAFQDPSDQLFLPTVRSEIEFGLFQMGLLSWEIDYRVQSAASSMGLETVLERKPHDLTAAERRLLTIASAIAAGPAVLCLDEPTRDLDAAGVERLSIVLSNRMVDGKTTIIATHDSDFAFEVCNYVVMLLDGKICYQGGWSELKNRASWLESHGVDAPTVWKWGGGGRLDRAMGRSYLNNLGED